MARTNTLGRAKEENISLQEANESIQQGIEASREYN
jgi:hypothetical protein